MNIHRFLSWLSVDVLNVDVGIYGIEVAMFLSFLFIFLPRCHDNRMENGIVLLVGVG